MRVQEAPEKGGPALAFSVAGSNLWAVGAWKWPGNAGRPLAAPEQLTLRLRVVGKVPPDAALSLALTGPTADAEIAKTRPRTAAAGIRLSAYDDAWADGTWHALIIPVADLIASSNGVDLARIDGLTFSTWVGESAADFTLYVASAEFTLPPLPKSVAPAPTLTKTQKQQQAKLEATRALAARIKPDMTRSEVELIFPVRDPVYSHPERTRYYNGDAIFIDVPFDQTGGPNNRENRVNGPARVFVGKSGDK